MECNVYGFFNCIKCFRIKWFIIFFVRNILCFFSIKLFGIFGIVLVVMSRVFDINLIIYMLIVLVGDFLKVFKIIGI